MNKFFLTEGFQVEGNSEANLHQNLVSISNKTKFEVVAPARIEIYSILKMPPENTEYFDIIKIKPSAMNPSILFPKRNPTDSYFHPANGNVTRLPFSVFLDNGCPWEIIEEIKSTGYLLHLTSPCGQPLTLIPAKGFLSTLCRQLGIAKVEEGIDPLRDVYLASRLLYCEPFTLVYRTNGLFAKAFGCFSPKFANIPQTIILNYKEYLIKKFSNITVRHWEYTHSITSVDFSLNNKVFRINGMRVTPGVRLSLSDIGDSSYTLRTVLFCNGGVVTLPAIVQKKRSVNLDVKEMVDAFCETLPEIDVIKKIAADTSKEFIENKGEVVNRLLVSIGFSSAIGKYSSADLYQEFAELKGPASLEEVLEFILKIPGKIKSKECKSCLNRVSETIGKIFTTKPFSSFR